MRLTTNALAFPGDLIPVLRESCAQVKVSLHGDRDFHNDMVGAQGFDKTVDNLRRLLAADIPTSIQTMLAASGLWTPDWLATFCLKEGVRRLSILPFVPRGHGAACSGELMLSPLQRRFSREHIKQKRRLLSGHLDIRWLDFNQHPYFIIDTNGDALQEGGPGNGSRMLFRIPGKTI